MSAPPSSLIAMPTMVSRLPKFGSRPKSTAAANGVQTGPAAPTAPMATGAVAGATAGAGACAAVTGAASSTRLTNGFYHHPGPAGVNGSVTAPPSSVKQNGFIRVPTAFSMKWRKENGTVEEGGVDAEREWRRGKGGNVGPNRPGNNIHQYYSQRQLGSSVVSQRDGKKMTSSSVGKGPGFGPTLTSSSLALPQPSPRTLPLSKSGSPGSKLGQTAPGLTNGTKQTLNGLPGSKPRRGSSGSLKQPQSFVRAGGLRPASGPGSRSGSPLQKSLPASRSHSSESLGSAPPVQLTESDRFRSRSLNQVRRQPSPTLTPSSPSSSLPRSAAVTRSYSTNRAAERRLKELTPPSAQAPRGSLAKSLVTSQTSEGGGSGGGVKLQSAVASGRSGVSIPSLLPHIALKKPLLPSLGLSSKPSGISYKMSRPSFNKQSRPLRATPANVPGGDLEVDGGLTGWSDSTTENSPESTPDAPEREGLASEPLSQAEVLIVAETLEDMSLSSTSSLDRNDTSQEYMDDFDNLGNGGIGIMLLSSKNDEDDSGLDQSCARFDDDKADVNGVTKASGLCFLDDGMDWAGVRLSGDRGENRRARSSQPDYHDQGGSSLDLSPSDSCGSGGTYMWDEEGLEPLGGAAVTTASNSNTTHHIGSFDSDLNSIDILNNLDSCDLEDDDLMLDADFAEDASLHSDGDGMSHMAQWRRRQLCWGTQDVHNDNDSDFQCYNLTEDPGNKRTDIAVDGDLILDLCPSRSSCLSPGSPGLGLDVEELAEDCSAVRSQLEYLQRLLLQQEDVDNVTLTMDALSAETDDLSSCSDTQVQALLQEVQQLREDLRSRDRTIAQLTLQMTVPTVTVRCRCQETTGRMDRHTQTSVTEKESVASQTPWREHTSQILHSSSQEAQKPLIDRGLTPPPAQAPSPAKTRSEIPVDRPPDRPDPNAPDAPDSATEERGDDDGKRSTKERRRTYNRSLRPPQPSVLHLFLSPTPRPDSSSGCASAAGPPPKTRASSQLPTPPDPDSNGSSGVKLKTLAFAFGSSRLHKPKSH